MILILGERKRIVSYIENEPKEHLGKYENSVWYDGEFDFFMAEYQEGKIPEYYFEAGKIRIEYVDMPSAEEPQPTQLDRIESAINELGAESLPISKVETAIMEGVSGI